MPLEILRDRFSEEEHEELDKEVNDTTKAFNNLPTEMMLCLRNILLSCIVHSSDGKLNPKYGNFEMAQKLIDAHEDLGNMLSSALESKKYSEIRNLVILQRITSDEQRKLSESFKAKYHGAAADGFYEYLTHSEKSFPRSRYYAKCCSIVQSSGTGKSRMLTELGNKGVITIYINLRDEDDHFSFPPRDRIPSTFLTAFPDTAREYRADCYAFFTSLFLTVEEYLSTGGDTSGTKEGLMHWARQMCDMSLPPLSTARDDFFKKLASNYVKSYDLLRAAINEQTPEAVDKTEIKYTTANLRKVVRWVEVLSISGHIENGPHPLTKLTRLLDESFIKMAGSLRRIFPNDRTPKLVIAIDEAHLLAALQRNYRPLDVFCEAVNECSYIGGGVWVVLASTTSKVTDFSVRDRLYHSHRFFIGGDKLFPPYTYLGWDQCAPQLGTIDPEDVSKAKNIVGFGRPLWMSLKRTEISDPSKVLEFASEKLCGPQYDPTNTNQMLAVLGQRFAINVTFGHPDSAHYLEMGVARHLRVCLATTLDRTWGFTSYPSEPFLSCAAARNLHRTTNTVEDSLEKLLNLVDDGMIDMGERGELAGRLLWLLAKDLFIRARKGVTDVFPSSWDDHLVDCEMIPVVDWLEFIFGPRVWGTQGAHGREAFGNAYINFSHWVCMDANIARSKEGRELPLNLWTSRHWQRTSAVQCAYQQPLIDKVIPLYFKSQPGSGSAEDRMSQILICDEARESGSSEDYLHSITRREKAIGGERSSSGSCSLPYIAILADLAWEPSSFSVTFPEREVDDRCMCIYAPGIDTTTYPFLTEYPGIQQALKNLVQQQKELGKTSRIAKYLDAQLEFGSSATGEHMEWERGRKVPPPL